MMRHPAPLAPSPTVAQGWQARLSLGFARRDAQTILGERVHYGPLRVQKPLYPEGDAVCQVVLLHPPSGIVGGDHLSIQATVGPQAHAQLTTPGAGKWYRSNQAEAVQRLDFTLADAAVLEWLPQETIVFDAAVARMDTRIRLAEGSHYIGWEILCLGRLAAGEKFTRGRIGLHTRIERCNQPLWLERGHIRGNDPLLDSPVGWAGASVCGTLLATLPSALETAPLLEACRSVQPEDGAQSAVSALPGLLVARYLGDHSEAARHWFTRLWETFRPILLGRPALPPRIWNT